STHLFVYFPMNLVLTEMGDWQVGFQAAHAGLGNMTCETAVLVNVNSRVEYAKRCVEQRGRSPGFAAQ
ncbi:MAG TPA: hypothetical protein VF306_16915, partial [Pirellulales bacterium]